MLALRTSPHQLSGPTAGQRFRQHEAETEQRSALLLTGRRLARIRTAMGVRPTFSCRSARIRTGADLLTGPPLRRLSGPCSRSGDRGPGADCVKSDASELRPSGHIARQGGLSTGMPKEILGAQANVAGAVPAASGVRPVSFAPCAASPFLSVIAGRPSASRSRSKSARSHCLPVAPHTPEPKHAIWVQLTKHVVSSRSGEEVEGIETGRREVVGRQIRRHKARRGCRRKWAWTCDTQLQRHTGQRTGLLSHEIRPYTHEVRSRDPRSRAP